MSSKFCLFHSRERQCWIVLLGPLCSIQKMFLPLLQLVLASRRSTLYLHCLGSSSTQVPVLLRSFPMTTQTAVLTRSSWYRISQISLTFIRSQNFRSRCRNRHHYQGQNQSLTRRCRLNSCSNVKTKTTHFGLTVCLLLHPRWMFLLR